MAATTSPNHDRGAHGTSDNGPICARCQTGSLPRGFCTNLGLCWTCANPRTAAYFAQLAADTAARAARLSAATV